MLTVGQTNCDEICQMFGVSFKTAQRICKGKNIKYVTAQKIVAAFPTEPLKHIFRKPWKGYENWKKQVAKKQATPSVLIQWPAKTKIENQHSESTVAEVVATPAPNNMNNLNQPPIEPAANDGHSTQPKCLYPCCTARFCSARGLCPDHYWMARDYIRKGKTTWKKLEAKGKALPIKKRKRSDAAKWFLGETSAKNVGQQ